MKAIFIFLAFVMVNGSAIAAEEALNCRLVIHTTLRTGKKKVDVDEIHTPSRQDCKTEASLRRMITSETDDDVTNVKVMFGWREMN